MDPSVVNTPVPSNIVNTVRVSSRRFEPSPFFDCYVNADTVMGVYAGRYFAAFNGENVVENYWTLRRKAVLYDVPERPVQIEGPDAVPFMEHVFSRRIANLKEGRGKYTIACTPKGGIFIDGVLFNLSPNRYWYVQPDGALEAWLFAHSEKFNVTVSDPGSRVLQIQGPTSLEIMRAASGGAIDASMGYFQSGFFALGGQELYVSRTGWTGELGFEIYTQGASTDCKRLWKHLFDVGTSHGMVFGSIASMHIRRIEAGILDNGTDMTMATTPYHVGLGAFVDLDKQNFVGRAALESADRRPLLYGLKCAGAVPSMHDVVVDDSRIVGQVTAGARSPYLETGIGYVRFAEPSDWVARTVRLNTAQGESHPCEIVELPFYDKEKRIPRGIDSEPP